MKHFIFITFLLFIFSIAIGQISTDPSYIKVIVLEPDPNIKSIQKYEKLELGIIMPKEVDNLVKNYLAKHDSYPAKYQGINPFNPDDISVEANFYPPNNSKTEPILVYGFYLQKYKGIETKYNYDYWQEVETPHHWRIRFSPGITGSWKYKVNVVYKNKTLESKEYSFMCNDSDNKGYLGVQKKNGRFLEFKDNGETFFAIGMNIAFPRYPKGCLGSDPVKMIEHRDFIAKLGESDANFARLVLGPKTYNFEWEELGNYDAPFYLKKKVPPQIKQVGRLALSSLSAIAKSSDKVNQLFQDFYGDNYPGFV